jgi:hypothetical protein
MKTCLLFCLGCLILSLLFGCATPGQKFIDINYLADHEPSFSGTIGLAQIKDGRTDASDGYIGFRRLLDNSQETYFVNGMDLGSSMTDILSTYFRKNGFAVSAIKSFEPSPEDVSKAINGFDRIVSGIVNTFECRAAKKGATTEMILEIDLTLWVGTPDKHTLKIIPVAFSLERTELSFSERKLEMFVNQALQEVIQKALILQ